MHNEQGSGEIFAIYKNTQYPKPQIRVFIDFLVDKLEPMRHRALENPARP